MPLTKARTFDPLFGFQVGDDCFEIRRPPRSRAELSAPADPGGRAHWIDAELDLPFRQRRSPA